MHHERNGGGHYSLEGRTWALLRQHQENLSPQKSPGHPISQNCPPPGGGNYLFLKIRQQCSHNLLHLSIAPLGLKSLKIRWPGGWLRGSSHRINVPIEFTRLGKRNCSGKSSCWFWDGGMGSWVISTSIQVRKLRDGQLVQRRGRAAGDGGRGS